MPWTPESIMATELLCPIISDAFDIEVTIGTDTLKQKRFTVTWPGFEDSKISIDPIVELWRPINEQMRVKTDLNLCIFKHGEDQNGSTRTYEVSYGAIKRKHVDTRELYSEVDIIVPMMLESLITVADGWASADNGLALFLKNRNKSSIDNYLIGIGLKKRHRKMTKAERREAYLKEHPEHAKTAKPRNRKNPSA